jgi:peptidyl-dipeptidase Dcp
MKKNLLLLSIAAMTLGACQNTPKNLATKDNPLMQEFQNTYGIAPFELIKDEHFSPAIIKAIELAEAELKQIVDNSEPATFENTIAALDRVGGKMNDVVSVFYNLLSANTNKKLQEVAKEISPILSKFNDDIYLNDKLFERVKYVKENSATFHLNKEQETLLDKTYKNFIRSGANLSEEDKSKLREINKQLSKASLDFGDNVLNEVNEYKLVIEKQEDLAGLPQELIDAAAKTAEDKNLKGKWVFTLQNPSLMPFLQYSSNRSLRKEIWEAYNNLGNNNNQFDNKKLVIEMANLRMQKAQLLGYKTFADYSLEETMSKTPENVYKLLHQLWKPALEKAKLEAADIKAKMLQDGIKDNVQPYDWRYYAEKIRKERYDLDEQEIKPYFELNNVRNGIFMVTEKLYGLTFKQVNNLPLYHKDVTTWEVYDADKSLLGILYMDMHPRAGQKTSGAWMTSFREQKMVDGKRIIPIISIVCNFTPPNNEGVSLLTFDETTTFFHEFGHALHGLLSNTNYVSLAGTSVSRDFVELPSQVMENWASDPIVMKMYAKHYKTGEVIPDALIEKIQRAGTFDQGFATVEYLAASLLDLDYHTIQAPIKEDMNAFEKNSVQKMGLIGEIIPRYRSTYFKHIFSGGYSAGYYSYIWSGVLDTDAFDAFKSSGDVFNSEKAKSFRKNILEKGGTEDPAELYKTFRGKEPSIEPLLKKRGLYTPINIKNNN